MASERLGTDFIGLGEGRIRKQTTPVALDGDGEHQKGLGMMYTTV